jgi:hypothetical protein
MAYKISSGRQVLGGAGERGDAAAQHRRSAGQGASRTLRYLSIPFSFHTRPPLCRSASSSTVPEDIQADCPLLAARHVKPLLSICRSSQRRSSATAAGFSTHCLPRRRRSPHPLLSLSSAPAALPRAYRALCGVCAVYCGRLVAP